MDGKMKFVFGVQLTVQKSNQYKSAILIKALNLCDHGELVVLIWNVGNGDINRAVLETLNLKFAHLFDTVQKFNINSVRFSSLILF